MTQHSSVHILSCLLLFVQVLLGVIYNNITLKSAKKLFPIEVSTALLTWALFSGRHCMYISLSAPSLQESTEEGGYQDPVIYPGKVPAAEMPAN